MLVTIFARLGQHVYNELTDRHRAMNATCFVAIGLGNHGMEPLIVEIDLNGIDCPENPVNRTLVEIEETQRALVAGSPFNLG